MPAFVVLAGDYVGTWFGLSWIATYFIKLVIIFVIGYITWRGMRDVSQLGIILAAIICFAFLFMMVIGFTHMEFNPVQPFVPPGQSVFQSIGLGLAVGLWLYAGYDSLGLVAGELEDPQVIPKALIIAMPLVAFTYIPSVIAGVGSVGQWESWGSDGVTFSNVVALLSPTLALVFTGIAFFGQIAMYNSYFSTNARWFFVLADDNLAPKFLTKLNRYGAPSVTVVLGGMVSAIVALFDFVSILKMNVTAFLFAYSLLAVIACVIRIKEPNLERPFNFKLGNAGYIAMASLIIVIAVFAMFVNGTDYFLWGAAFLLLGIPLYWIAKKHYGGLKCSENDGISCLNKNDF